MTVSASPGIGFAFALQSAKGSAVSDTSDFKRQRVIQAQLGAVQQAGQFPQEVGGGYHSGGLYKSAIAAQGSVRMMPRLEGDMGYLLKALLGAPEASGTSDTGWYETSFKPADSVCSHPWLTARKFVPNCTAADQLGEEISDAKLNAFSLSVRPGQPAMLDLGLLGISSQFVDAATASAWGDAMEAYEGTDSVILGGVNGTQALLGDIAGVDLGGGAGSEFSVPALDIQLNVQNRFSGEGITPELVIGSLQMDDLILLGQTISFTLTYKWKDPNLYKAVYAWDGGTSVGNSPTAKMLKTDVTLTFKSANVLTAGVNEQLQFVLNSCSLQCPNGIVLSGGQYVTIQVQGVCEIAATPDAYATVKLKNGVAYTDLGVSYT